MIVLEKTLNLLEIRKNSKSIGDKLKSFNGIDCILDVMNENSF